MSVGQPANRLDGPAKVSGAARYAADTPVEGVLYAVQVPSTIPKGALSAIDVSAAEGSPGVVRVFTYMNCPRFGAVTNPPAGHTALPLQDERILYEGQPIALVVADSLERATAAAKLVRATYREAPFETNFLERLDRGEAVPAFGVPADLSAGDLEAARASANVSIEGTYFTADRHHNAMEPSATLAVWHDGRLTLHDAVQGVVSARTTMAQALQIDPAQLRVVSQFVGGGFGCKGWVWPHQILAAMAARELQRPVKLVETRAQAHTGHGYQPASRQTVALFARADGTLTGIRHDSILAGSFAGEHVEGAGWGTRALYASPAITTTHRLVRVDRPNPTPMRAPLEGVGLVAVEIAMDELAEKLGMDPLELRLKNYAETDPFDGRPFSSKKLRECYEEGARRFGWSKRTAAPRSMRDGNDLVGYGMATALMQTFRGPAKARITIDRTGQVLIESATQEIGTGVRTIMPQIAADALGVPLENVSISLGDTNLPEAPMTAGSSSTASVGSAVQDAAIKLKRRLDEAGAGANRYPDALAKLGVERLSADGEWTPGEETSAMYTFGAVFTEVRVDEDIPIPRVSRVVCVYSAGKIINPKTARSQITGGVIWGIGQALLERSEMDNRLGRFLSKNLAGYLVPVNADVPDIDASFVEEFDSVASPIGARGIGELAATGIGASIANAVSHATGIRVRELPIRPEMLLATA